MGAMKVAGAMRIAVLACALVPIWLSGCSRVEERPATDQLTDERLREMVQARLQSDANIRRLNLEVAADAGRKSVELQGVAFTERQRDKAVELARSARPDLAVDNRIDVTPYEMPREMFDEEMMTDVKTEAGRMGDRLSDSLDDGWLHMKVVARLIADSKTPQRTINVDVADSVVTLRGTVPSQESRGQAETVVRSVSGIADVRNQLIVER